MNKQTKLGMIDFGKETYVTYKIMRLTLDEQGFINTEDMYLNNNKRAEYETKGLLLVHVPKLNKGIDKIKKELHKQDAMSVWAIQKEPINKIVFNMMGEIGLINRYVVVVSYISKSFPEISESYYYYRTLQDIEVVVRDLSIIKDMHYQEIRGEENA